MWARTQGSAAAAVENMVSRGSVAVGLVGSHRVMVLVQGPQWGGGGDGGYYRGLVHCSTLHPSCNSADETCWRVLLVGCSGENMSPGSWEGGHQVLRGSGGPHHRREIRDEAGVVLGGILRPEMDRAPLKELLYLQKMVRTAGRRSCLVRMGTATKKEKHNAWR